MRRPWFDLLRLINILRLEDGSPQTFRNLRLGLDLNPVLSNDERMEEVRVSSSSHFRNLDFSRAHLHRERILFQRVTLQDRKSTRLNSSHITISYAVFCLK